MSERCIDASVIVKLALKGEPHRITTVHQGIVAKGKVMYETVSACTGGGK